MLEKWWAFILIGESSFADPVWAAFTVNDAEEELLV